MWRTRAKPAFADARVAVENDMTRTTPESEFLAAQALLVPRRMRDGGTVVVVNGPRHDVIRVFTENNEKLRELLFAAIPKIGPQPQDACATALEGARI